jgi:hypothetical protein
MTNLRKTEKSTATSFLHAESWVDDEKMIDLVEKKNDATLKLLPPKMVFSGLSDFSILLIFKFIDEIYSS